MSLTGSFQYAFIPADASAPIEERTGDKSGGLEHDILSKEAKQYFFEQSDGSKRAAALDTATPSERKALAQQIRDQVSSSGQQNNRMAELDDDALLNIVRTSQASASCEIMALTVPTVANGFLAVSMYGDDNARANNLPLNYRATKLMAAAGHSMPDGEDGSPGGVFGDVFVGRCKDDEVGDVWERVDFTMDDVATDTPKHLEWCRVARERGGGGGHGASASPSLSGMMSNAFSGGGGGKSSNGVTAMLTNPNGEQTAEGYTWSQTNDEVELKFTVASGTKAKYVKVNFGSTKLKVTLAGQTLAQGETGGPVAVDECTYTIQDEGGKRELCVTLGKKNKTTWAQAVIRI